MVLGLAPLALLIMIAAFSGFTAGSFVGLQMFGLGLSVAILLDATIVRAILVPAVMKLMGRWNWYLPPAVARVMRVREPEAAPVAQPAMPAFAAGNGHPPAVAGERTAEPVVHRMEERR